MRFWSSRYLPGLALLALVSSPAAAQAPIQLFPQPSGTTAAPSAQPAPQAAPQGGFVFTPPEEGSQPAAKPSSGIVVEQLGAAPAGIVGGILDPGEGGLGVDLWQGVPMATAQHLLAGLSVPGQQPAAWDLLRRALLSAARAPEGAADDKTASLPELRLDLLGRMGDLDDLQALAASDAAVIKDPALSKVWAGAMLRGGRTDDVCKVSADRDPSSASVFWQQVAALCAFYAGNGSDASLSVDLLREQAPDDKTFFALADMLSGLSSSKKPPPAPEGGFSPVHLAMIAEAGLAWPAPAGATDLGYQAGLLVVKPTPVELRIAAAERLVAAGAIRGDVLTGLYAEPSFTDAEKHGALGAAKQGQNTPMLRALLYQAASAQSVPAARTEVVGRALDLAPAPAVGAVWAKLLDPQRDTAWVAPAAVAALASAGEMQPVQGWYELASGVDPASARQMWPLAMAAGIPSVPAGDLSAWVSEKPDNAAQSLAFLKALGVPVKAPWSELAAIPKMTAPAGVNPAIFYALDEASAAGRRGETVLLAVTALGNDGANRGSPLILAKAVEALSRVGLDAPARQMAVELIAAQPRL
ncbi:hypothetical protein [Radicibacter daui]|uniref:hypothetical protein n=1 Tax=Radicibacter daui TaxID=3064829 RepID=UPI004046FD2D